MVFFAHSGFRSRWVASVYRFASLANDAHTEQDEGLYDGGELNDDELRPEDLNSEDYERTYNRCECIGLFCSIGFDACKPVDYPSREREADPAEELEDEADLGQEEPDGFGGAVGVEDQDELEPVIRTKKRQRKSQGSGNVF